MLRPQSRSLFSFFRFLFSASCSRFDRSGSVREEGRQKNLTESETRHQDRQPAAQRPSPLTNHTLHSRRPKAAVRLQLVAKNCHEEQKLPTIRKPSLSFAPRQSAARETDGWRRGQDASGGPLPACFPSLSAAGASRTTLTPPVKPHVNYSPLGEVPWRWRGPTDAAAVRSGAWLAKMKQKQLSAVLH